MSSFMGIFPLINMVVVVVVCISIAEKNNKDFYKYTLLKKGIIGPVIGLIVFTGLIILSGLFISLASEGAGFMIVTLLILLLVVSIDLVIISIVLIVSRSKYNRKTEARYREQMAQQSVWQQYPQNPPPYFYQ